MVWSWLPRWWTRRSQPPHRGGGAAPAPPRPWYFRPRLESLEDREVLSSGVVPTAGPVVENRSTLSQPLLIFDPVPAISATAGIAFQGPVGKVQLFSPALPQVTINWGDGVASRGSLRPREANGSYDVYGTTTFQQAGQFNIAVVFLFREGASTPTSPAPVSGASSPPGTSGAVTDGGLEEGSPHNNSVTVQVTRTGTVVEVVPGGNGPSPAKLVVALDGVVQRLLADATGQVPWQRLPEPPAPHDLAPAAVEADLAELVKMIGPNLAGNRRHFGWANAAPWQSSLASNRAADGHGQVPLFNPADVIGYNPAALTVPIRPQGGWAPHPHPGLPGTSYGLEAFAYDLPGVIGSPVVPPSPYGRVDPADEADRELAALLTPVVRDMRDARKEEVRYDLLCSWCVASYFFAVFMDGHRAASLVPVPPPLSGVSV
jgi:hypothetical protein